jgi:hypothetical protein
VLGFVGGGGACLRAATHLLGKAGPPSLVKIATSVACRTLPHAAAAAAAGCVLGDLAVDAWKEFAEEPAPPCAHLSAATRCGGLVEGLIIRTVSEAGRLVGHAMRGRLFANFGVRFNWFGYMWAGAPAVERREAARRTAVRVLVSGAAVAAVLRAWRS